MDILFLIALICGLISFFYILTLTKEAYKTNKILLLFIILYVIGYVGVYTLKLM